MAPATLATSRGPAPELYSDAPDTLALLMGWRDLARQPFSGVSFATKERR